MRLTHIIIENILGVTRIDTGLSKAVSLWAGDNYAGKSSIREAIKAALLGVPERVLKKKDFDQLVHDGGKTGIATVEFEQGVATFTAPKGEQSIKHDFKLSQWERIEMALPYCLDPALFAEGAADARRQLLFSLTGASSKREDIIAALQARSLSEDAISAISPLLRAGFPAATKFAEEKARDAKATWKATTGEAYGHVKAESWTAEEPSIDTTRIEQLKTRAAILEGKIGTEQAKLGAAEQKLKAWLNHEATRADDRKVFARLSAAETKLDRDQDELLKWQDQVKVLEQQAGTGPRVGLIHDLARLLSDVLDTLIEDDPYPTYQEARTVLAAYEAQYGDLDSQDDPEAAAKLPDARRARDLMQRSVDNDRRDIDQAKAAGARLSATTEKGSQDEVESVQTILAGLQQEHVQIDGELTALLADQQEATRAAGRTKVAALAHREAQDWQIAIDALSPAGIPAEILGKALDPFNESLIGIADTFGWPGVAIDGDMMITAGGRAYALLSESEKWRTNTIIVVALAGLSGAGIVALDRVDVLNVSGRAELIDGLDALAADNCIDTALLFGTFKAKPNVDGFPGVTAFWVEGGTLREPARIKEAA